ncbi:MAG TPA: hypothetical protein VI564_06030 [Candidatus Nanoarchaeia archaeon]|nr:hypothetical protein [Candidatus Nanoarchaeia archaeon]
MKKDQNSGFFRQNRKGLLIGFIFGAIVAPFLATFGLILPFFEVIRPILIGPMDFMGHLIPNIQTAPDTFYAPWYKWVLTLGFNGICYALLGGLIQAFTRKSDKHPYLK